jgi:hypothetical protein
MLGLTTLSKWFRSTSSIGNELEARLKAGEEAIQAEWTALVARVEALEKASAAEVLPVSDPVPVSEPAPAPAAEPAPEPAPAA